MNNNKDNDDQYRSSNSNATGNNAQYTNSKAKSLLIVTENARAGIHSDAANLTGDGRATYFGT